MTSPAPLAHSGRRYGSRPFEDVCPCPATPNGPQINNSGTIPQESTMEQNDKEHQNRIEALANAVRHRLKEESADDIVKSAQKYFQFLEGNSKD